jgi:hypothetical protein
MRSRLQGGFPFLVRQESAGNKILPFSGGHTCSPCPFHFINPVNNLWWRKGNDMDWSVNSGFFTHCSQARIGEQTVHINSLSVLEIQL